MELSTLFRHRVAARIAPLLSAAVLFGGAVTIASTGAAEAPAHQLAGDDCEVEDGSIECFNLHIEYIACLLTGKKSCVMPCCSLELPEEPKRPD